MIPIEPSYNAQAAVEIERRLLLGQRVSQTTSDKQALEPTLAAIPAEADPVTASLVWCAVPQGTHPRP